MAAKIWFITGTSRGFGREWAIAALDRGDQVAATARDLRSLDDLVAKYGAAVLPVELDVTDRAADLAAVRQAHQHFGRLDVVVNNAGYGQFGMVEEISEEEIRAQLETNVLGALWITQAALPYLREQGSGHIIQVSSIGGISAFPRTGAYHASKWALEGLSQSLAQEVAGFGIKVTLIEPGGFATDWAGPSAKNAAQLPACRAFVHHGGCGTTNAGLRAGLPTLILWTLPDQGLWGARVKRLKVGTGRRFSATTEKSLLADLRAMMADLDTRHDVRVIVLTGADPAFCAGLDLTELGQADSPLAMAASGPVLPRLSKPLIGAVNGAAITGGLELALACDFLIASELARFADTHARVGIQPGWGLTVELPEAVGLRRARQMSATGNFVDARTALAWGLVNHVVRTRTC